jgi:3-carboxy-cis,cis-muconate cycloisomerase
MSGAPFEHPLLSGLFGDVEVASLFSAEAQIRAMLAVEAALSLAQGETGVIPEVAAARIAEVAETLAIDPAALAAGCARDGMPVPALVAGLREAVGGTAAQYVHWGATSQDIMDTALILSVRDALAILERRSLHLAGALADLADDHRQTVMAARTRSQNAAPTAFGLKAAGWLMPLVRHHQRLAELRPRALLLSFGGACGNLAALGEDALPVEAALAALLDLPIPPTPWHTQRDGLAEIAGWIATLTDSLGKMGADLILLAQSDVAEIRMAGGGGSSTLPNKNNPVRAEALVTLARFNATQIGGLHQAAQQEHERGGAGWQLEWLIVPPMVVAVAAALRQSVAIIDGLTVDAARMRANIEASNGLLLAEGASFALAAHMPLPEAQAMVKKACRKVADSGQNLMDVLAKGTDAPVDWAKLKDPANHLGSADALIDRALAAARVEMDDDPHTAP